MPFKARVRRPAADVPQDGKVVRLDEAAGIASRIGDDKAGVAVGDELATAGELILTRD